MTLLVTGGCGFIGSTFLKTLCERYPKHTIVNVDAKTYAARPPMYKKRPKNLIEEEFDIRDQLAVKRCMERYKPDHVFHLAAESHVCRSIKGPKDFITTNINGTWNLLEEFKDLWQQELKAHRFVHISTDEVFGEIKTGKFDEKSQIQPRSPYASSKASSDLLVLSYGETYGMDVVVTNCSNNFGPNQHDEKLVPKTILRILGGQPVQIYGTGEQVRDWIFVEDAAEAFLAVFEKGLPGNRYCIGGNYELTNLQMVRRIYDLMLQVFGESAPPLKMQFTNSRPTDDFRYAISTKKIEKLGWKPKPKLVDQRLQHTIMWYYERWLKSGARTQGSR